MPRFRLTLAYVGTRCHGWQIQEKPHPPPTIQGELEAVLARVLCQKGQIVRVHGAGRTDSGVHADAQIAHCDIPDAKAHLDWQRIFNTSLAPDICVLDIAPVADTFHARLDAKAKTYTYQLWTEPRWMPPRLAPFAWNCGPLDTGRIHAALPYLTGSYDCRSLQNAGTPMENTVRTICNIALDPALALMPHANALALRVRADGFLKQMVRNMTGLLVAVGRGTLAPENIPALLAACDRRLAPPTAPAHGLCLTNVHY